MKRFTTKALFVFAFVLLAGVILPAAVKAKAEEVYTLDATDEKIGLSGLAKKDQIPEGNYGTNGYFKFVGQNIRANSDTLIIELAKREGSNIQFTVTGAANLQLVVSSNGNTNASDCILIRMDDNAELIPAGYEKSVFVVEGSEPVTVYFFNLTAGTYKLKSPEGTPHDNRGFRLFSAKVTQYPDGNIPQRPDWGKVSAPKLSSVKQDGEKIVVTYDADISFDGGDYVKISMFDTKGELIDSAEVTSEGKQAVAKFVPSASGKYTFTAEFGRYGDAEKQSGASDPFDFLMPLKDFEKFTVTNIGGGSVILEWSEIPEADVYQIYLQYEGSEGETLATLSKDTLNFVVNDLTIDKEYTFTVAALAPGRDNDHPRSISASLKKIVRDRVDRPWSFAYFGQSVN